jgi:hypothetical protein
MVLGGESSLVPDYQQLRDHRAQRRPLPVDKAFDLTYGFLRLLPNLCPTLLRRLNNRRSPCSRQDAFLRAYDFTFRRMPQSLAQRPVLRLVCAAAYLTAFRAFSLRA